MYPVFSVATLKKSSVIPDFAIYSFAKCRVYIPSCFYLTTGLFFAFLLICLCISGLCGNCLAEIFV